MPYEACLKEVKCKKGHEKKSLQNHIYMPKHIEVLYLREHYRGLWDE